MFISFFFFFFLIPLNIMKYLWGCFQEWPLFLEENRKWASHLASGFFVLFPNLGAFLVFVYFWDAALVTCFSWHIAFQQPSMTQWFLHAPWVKMYKVSVHRLLWKFYFFCSIVLQLSWLKLASWWLCFGVFCWP